ncbi:signal peptidase II [Gryllotalpicola ginsengisoli]|uniref:signal peptidase II n=1 Tax=Gryllotalpicola ginsengisoli TaxID=444608 RepID=UPI0003B6B079|nr:signal peptidase II [Gryllotalpicola ginsengisoli]
MEPSAPAKVSVRAILVLAVVAVCVFIADQVAKALVVAHLAQGEQVNVIGDLLVLRYVLNPGAAFSIGTGSTWIFTIIAIAVLVFVLWYARRIRSIAWSVVFGLLLGGLLGNLCDRLFRPPALGQGEVVDFIKIPLLPAIFNLADSAIVAAMALFLILTLRGVSLDGHRPVPADAPQPTDVAADVPEDGDPRS